MGKESNQSRNHDSNITPNPPVCSGHVPRNLVKECCAVKLEKTNAGEFSKDSEDYTHPIHVLDSRIAYRLFVAQGRVLHLDFVVLEKFVLGYVG
jgi:hypothetical protein